MTGHRCLFHIQKAAAVAAAFFVAACATLTETPDELAMRLDEAIERCESSASIAILDELRAGRLLGPHRCIEQRVPAYQSRLLYVTEDRRSYFEQTQQCSFTLRHVREEIIAHTLRREAIQKGWMETHRIGGLACRRSTCNGRPRCRGSENWSGAIFIDSDTQTGYSFKWDGLDTQPNTLHVHLFQNDSLDCTEDSGRCFPPNPSPRDTE